VGLSKLKQVENDNYSPRSNSFNVVVPEKCPFCLCDFSEGGGNPSCPVCSGSSIANSLGAYYTAELKDSKRSPERSFKQNPRNRNAKKSGGKQTFILFQQSFGKANYTPSVYPSACIIGCLAGLLLGVATALFAGSFSKRSTYSFPEIKIYDPRLLVTDHQSKIEFSVFNGSPNDFKDLSFSVALYDEQGQLIKVANFKAKELLNGRKFKKTNVGKSKLLNSLESTRFEAVIDGLKGSFASVKVSGYSF
jgi:hypothetical protein